MAVSMAVAADVQGRFGKLYEHVAAESERLGLRFACVLCVGEFFPREDEDSTADGIDVAEYLSGRAKAPLPTYFLRGSDFNGLTWLKAIGASGMFCDNMEFLGSAGVRELHGLTVTFVSDSPDAGATEKAIGELAEIAAQKGFVGSDILLSNSWPTAIASSEHLDGEPAAPAPLRKPCTLAGCAAALMRPRYHFAAGQDQLWERAAYENAAVPHVGRFVALPPLAGGGRDDAGNRPLHALTATTLGSLPAAELWERPERLTPCPYDSIGLYASFPAAVKSKYVALLAEICPSCGGKAGRAPNKRPSASQKPAERRAAAVVGYSDDSDDSDDDDDDDDSNGSESESGSDSDSDSAAEEAKRAAKRRKATAANPPPSVGTAHSIGGGGSSKLGSVEDLFATTTQSAALAQKEDDFQVGEWDAKDAEAKLRESLTNARQKAELDFINEGEKNSLSKGASSRLGRNGGTGNNSKPGCVTGSIFRGIY